MRSREIAWRWVTSDSVLHIGECELLYAHLVVSAASTDTHLYDGTNTTGDKIVTLESAIAVGADFSPVEPVYCRKGLYVDVGTGVTGVFVQFRGLVKDTD